ncbi:hypothetical protein BC659_1149 [Sediminibacterium goheungense]|uniref:Uncharacterized protein n=2 Tax=Sediminibacterium goheungense TaxID=1086393 RepID=A0A4R6J2D6_9BACT|nr:hypothetical protein BC659_1149 [Sediminibacterium goheungense]
MIEENELAVIEHYSTEELVRYIQRLVAEDFPKLVQLLYRLDISEAKLKETLALQKDTDAGILIAQMIINRLAQKKKSREEFARKNWDGSEEERW